MRYVVQGLAWLSIDPGKKALAWAAWDGWALFACGMSRLPNKQPHGHLGDIAKVHAQAIPGGVDLVVVEEMAAPYERQKDTAQKEARTLVDLLQLQAIGGMVAGTLVRPGGDIHPVKANDWKGSMGKDKIPHWVSKTLTQPEADILAAALALHRGDLRHNIWEAVAIGLTYSRRLKIT